KSGPRITTRYYQAEITRETPEIRETESAPRRRVANSGCPDPPVPSYASLLRRRRPQKVPSPSPAGGGGSGRGLVRGSPRPFEGVDRLHDLDLDGRGFLRKRLSVRRHTHDESVMVGHGELGLDLLHHPGRLGGIHHVGVTTDADQGNVGLHFFDVWVRIHVSREPVPIPVQSMAVRDTAVA